MPSVFSRASHRAQIGYNGFDMSHSLKFSSTVGELLPVYYDMLQPGDKVTLSHEIMTRSMPLDTAAMLSLSEVVDWFFVPLKQIYTFFGDWYYGIDDIKTSFLEDSNLPEHLPYISAAQFDQLLVDAISLPDTYFPSLVGTQYRLMEMLGVPGLTQYGYLHPAGAAAKTNKLSLNPYLFCAYQKIYYDYYRLDDREYNNPSAFNVDKFANDVNEITATQAADMFRLRYRPWKRTFFTADFTSPVFSGYGVDGSSQSLWQSFKEYIYPVTNVQPTVTSSNSSTGEVTGGSVSSNRSTGVVTRLVQSGTDGVTFLSPHNIRVAFAVDKLMEITRRAGKSYDKQTLAHFGVDVPQGIEGDVMFLGSSSSTFKVGDVISTAGTESTALGEVGGKAYGYGKSGSIKFSAPCHGVLMAIYSIVPDVNYSQFGFDRLNTLINQSDYFREEYDNLGMQPLYLYQCDTRSESPYFVRGWQYRYMELKCKYNKVLGGMLRGRGLDSWVPQTYRNSSTYESYLINPTYLNNVMLLGYNFNTVSGLADVFKSDPFIHDIHFNVKKASKMSTFSLENL